MRFELFSSHQYSIKYTNNFFQLLETLEENGITLTAYPWQDLSSLLADLAVKLAQPFTQSQIAMHLHP